MILFDFILFAREQGKFEHISFLKYKYLRKHDFSTNIKRIIWYIPFLKNGAVTYQGLVKAS